MTNQTLDYLNMLSGDAGLRLSILLAIAMMIFIIWITNGVVKLMLSISLVISIYSIAMITMILIIEKYQMNEVFIFSFLLLIIIVTVTGVIAWLAAEAKLNFQVRHLYFAAGVLVGLFFLITLSMAMYYFASSEQRGTAGKEIFGICVNIIPPIATLVLGYYFGASEAFRTNPPAEPAEPTKPTESSKKN